MQVHASSQLFKIVQGDSPNLEVIRNPDGVVRKRKVAKPVALSVGVKLKA